MVKPESMFLKEGWPLVRGRREIVNSEGVVLKVVWPLLRGKKVVVNFEMWF